MMSDKKTVTYYFDCDGSFIELFKNNRKNENSVAKGKNASVAEFIKLLLGSLDNLNNNETLELKITKK
ncbi:MAG: hypothetical protein IKD78_02665 [Bacteroidales bacterium]|nr:hypothetical protein [Bacteroidales bacterium]